MERVIGGKRKLKLNRNVIEIGNDGAGTGTRNAVGRMRTARKKAWRMRSWSSRGRSTKNRTWRVRRGKMLFPKRISSFLFVEYVQQAPEIIREFISTKHLPPGSQASDMYSLGMVLYQILFKLEPFYERNMQPKSESISEAVITWIWSENWQPELI